MLPSDVLLNALKQNRRDGWMPRGPGKGGYRDKSQTSKCCFLTAMCRYMRTIEPQGFALPEAFAAREALREQLGVAEIAEWNDTRISFAEIEEGVMRAVRVLKASGR